MPKLFNWPKGSEVKIRLLDTPPFIPTFLVKKRGCPIVADEDVCPLPVPRRIHILNVMETDTKILKRLAIKAELLSAIKRAHALAIWKAKHFSAKKKANKRKRQARARTGRR